MKFRLKKKIIRFKRLFKAYNFSIDEVLKYSVIIGAMIAVIIIIIKQMAFNWYVNINYFAFTVVFAAYFALLAPIIISLTLPFVLLIDILIIIMLHYKDLKMTDEEKNYVIKSAIEKNKINIITAEKLSDVVMLPVETVSRCLNYMVADKLVTLTINDKGLLVYNFEEPTEVNYESQLKGISDAN